MTTTKRLKKIPLYELERPVVDFQKFIAAIDRRYGWNHRDFAGRYSAKGDKLRAKLTTEWLERNGYADKAHVLDGNYPKGSPEMKLRIEINSKMWPEVDAEVDRVAPYQDFWHFMGELSEITRGGTYYFDIRATLEDPKTPEFAKTILRAMDVELTGHPAYVDGEVIFYTDW